MIINQKTRELLPRLLPKLLELPEGQHFDVRFDGYLEMQCWTQAAVKAARACFPGVVWAKSYEGGELDWWEYRGLWGGVPVKIYACQEAPPTCRLIEEEIEVEEEVPVAWEKKPVKKVVAKWECGDGGGAAS